MASRLAVSYLEYINNEGDERGYRGKRGQLSLDAQIIVRLCSTENGCMKSKCPYEVECTELYELIL